MWIEKQACKWIFIDLVGYNFVSWFVLYQSNNEYIISLFCLLNIDLCACNSISSQLLFFELAKNDPSPFFLNLNSFNLELLFLFKKATTTYNINNKDRWIDWNSLPQRKVIIFSLSSCARKDQPYYFQ